MILCYSDYEATSVGLSGWAIMLLILLFIWGILQIILFFKIWGMTTDVEKILSVMRQKDSFIKAYLSGNDDALYETLNQKLYKELCSICEEIRYSANSKERTDFFVKHRDIAISKFQKKYDLINRSIPERFHTATYDMIAFGSL